MIIIKAAIISCLFYVFYRLLLGQETYYRANRFFLLFGLFAAFTLPYISLPEYIEDQGILEEGINNVVVIGKPLSGPEVTIAESDGIPPSTQNSKGIGWFRLNVRSWIMLLYLFGVVVLSLNLSAQILSIISRIFRSKDRVKGTNYTIVNSETVSEPCSFFQFIFINPAKYDHRTYIQILDHEKIHVNKWHCLDLLIAEIAVIVLWFNPIIWLYRREVEKNLEFETDQTLLNDSSYSVDAYQKSLVEIAVRNKPLLVTTNYNQSLLKQRIMRMNAKRSHGFNYWKYLFALPLLFGILMLLNQPLSLSGQSEDWDLPLVMEDCQKLLRAIRSNDEDQVSELLNTVDPNCSFYGDGEPRSALVAAARIGHLDIGQMLIEAGADVEYHARGDESPLMAAARYKNLQFVRLLIEEGAEIDKVVKGDGTALINAVRSGDLEIAKALLDGGADPYLNVPGDEYAMYHARAANNKPMVQLLLQYTDQE